MSMMTEVLKLIEWPDGDYSVSEGGWVWGEWFEQGELIDGATVRLWLASGEEIEIGTSTGMRGD